MKKKKNNPAAAPMDYYDHLEVFRWKILRVLAVLAVAAAACYIFIDPVVRIMKEPIARTAVSLVYLRPYEKFLSYLKISLFAGIVVTLPYALIDLASFLYPALKKGEKNIFIAVCVAAPLVFFGGMFFAFRVIVPGAMNFFLNFAPGDAVKPFWSVGEYFDMMISLMMACAFLFLIPLVLLFLIRIRVLPVRTLDRFRGVIILIIAVLAGIFSPPDVVSQLLIGVPLYLLFELTVLIGRWL